MDGYLLTCLSITYTLQLYMYNIVDFLDLPTPPQTLVWVQACI